ncbi:hypothetical protein GRI97_03405 [Altererythrobacter xixiisoli]|uniref:Argininosuccinate lyase n=1 Tax=Croceibacterium xixiisoli TaxID=1476466 RepID=A0A6I4TQ79_9SPHN|nr:hypothetical protein [Croceibacterium xixiisoli]MXO98034.1 hypothetical protein [Croceibacterium xixiisoli]
MNRRLSVAVPALLLVLAACDSKEAATGEAVQSEEVLPGTINDEMIPLDELTSQPPIQDPSLIPPSEGGPTPRAIPTAAATPGADPAAEATPAAEPSAAVTPPAAPATE